MINHIWGLVHHPDQEWKTIRKEKESLGHFYTHHVLWLAAIPVVSAFIGTTQFGWTFGGKEAFQVSYMNGIALGIAFYAIILGAVAMVGSLIHKMASKYPECPSKRDCIIFAGYIATPMFLSGLFALYPIFWLCALAVVAGISYTAYLLYKGIPGFLGIDQEEGFIFSHATLAVGVLILEAMLAIVVLLWSMSSEHSIVWHLFR
jgi:hypothetical protein